MQLLGLLPDTLLRTAVIVPLALLTGISAGMRSTKEPRPSMTPNSLVSLHIEDRYFLMGPSRRASNYTHDDGAALVRRSPI